jgi:branched-chain amino acid transport system permease protein
MSDLLQFLFSGMTVGAVYALVALGFTIIYNASDVVNFAQGEFVMLGGMLTFALYATGVPLPIAALIAIAATAADRRGDEQAAIEPARGAPVVSLIIITIGVSIFIRGVAQLVFRQADPHASRHFRAMNRSEFWARRSCRKAFG